MTQRPARPIATVTALSHVDLEVRDLERSIAFYQQVLGLDIFDDDRTHPDKPSIKGLVGDFAIELHQNLTAQSKPALPGGSAPSTSPCLSFSVENAEFAFAQLKAAGHVAAEAITQVQGVKMFFVNDPDGHVFELIQFPSDFRTLADLAPLLRSSPDAGA
jgi:glyoxylase I family protein